MRIVHLIESSGGSARVALVLAQAMVRAKHDVTLIYSPLRADPRFEDDLKAADSRLTILTVPLRREVGFHDLLALWSVFRLLRRTGPYDILHAHSSKAGAIARLVGAFFPRMKVVYTPHAFVTMGTEGSFFYKIVEKILSHFNAAIVAVSLAERTHAVRDLGLSEKKVVVIPNGLTFESPATRAQARERMGWADGDLIVGFVGRLSCQKNPLRLVDAFSSIAYPLPHLKLAVVGDGPLLEVTKARVLEKEMGVRTRFWEGQEARLFIPGFDVLFCSSDYEGFPLAFIEALQVGVPIVTTPVGGAAECVLPGKTGFISKDFETESLSEALRLYVRLDPAVRRNMVEQAQKRGRLFTQEGMTSALLDLYRSLVRIS